MVIKEMLKEKNLIDKISSEQAVIAIIGLGYVGLSLIDAFGNKKFPLIGYDVDVSRIAKLKQHQSYISTDLDNIPNLIKRNQLSVSSDSSILKGADVIIICVKSSLDAYNLPDFTNLHDAFQKVLAHLTRGQLIILQSTTYPGMTEEELLPLLEKSQLKVGVDFNLAYVPEVSNIGDLNYTFNTIPKLISGITPSCLEVTKQLYKKICVGIESCSSTQVAEAAKVLQNTYRLINISMINEMKILFDMMDIDIWDVVKAASCKPFGFSSFLPGPGAGGDCIPVDPIYLSWKAKLKDGPTTMIDRAVEVNLKMPSYVVKKIIQGLNQHNKPLHGAKVLVLGVAYKKDVNDIRQSASLKILSILKSNDAEIHYHDPFVKEIFHIQKFPDLELKSEDLAYEKLQLYDAVVIATDHSYYDWSKIVEYSQLIIDCHNVTKNVKNEKTKIIRS